MLIPLHSHTNDLKLHLKAWEVETTEGNYSESGHLSPTYYRNNFTTYVALPDIKDVIYLHINSHRGYSRILLNGSLLSTVGSINNIKDGRTNLQEPVPIPYSLRVKGKLNSVEVINYSDNKNFKPSFYLSSNKSMPVALLIYEKVTKTLPLAYSIIVFVILISYLRLKDPKEQKSNSYFTLSLILFLLFFIISSINNESLIRTVMNPVIPILSLAGWFAYLLYFTIKYYNFDYERQCFHSFISIAIVIGFSIIVSFTAISINMNLIYKLFQVCMNLTFLIIIYKIPKPDLKTLRPAFHYAFLLNLINFVQTTVNESPDLNLPLTGIIIVIICNFITFFDSMIKKIEASAVYSSKLFKTMERNREELAKKDVEISELKNSNDDIQREKSLFFSTLGKTLRAPLNSIIGYSENLYTAEKIEEVTPLVTEIIVEADKIFQSINNIMDFSTRDFTNNDLLLKDFRMKEIFENSIYDSPTIGNFRNRINYNPVGISDKVLIKGNPIIYKQIVSNILQFLISLNPDTIDYTLFNNGITDTHMNLAGRFSANNLNKANLSTITPLASGKDTFTKYIKLYDIYFNEEHTDNCYIIDLKFQCGISPLNKKKQSSDESNALILERNISVLVVEDYIPNLNIVKMHLSKMGCDVITATNGEDAISEFQKNVVDIILMDINMPLMDGWSATEAIRSMEEGLDVMIIGLTASSLDLDIRHCFESGMDDVLVKPIRKKQLYNKLLTLEEFEPVKFPSLANLRADYGISKLETETLFISTINQIAKQLEVLEVLISACDCDGLKREITVLIHASLIINAFYFTRLIRNLENAFFLKDEERIARIHKSLTEIITKVKEDNAVLFGN